MVFDDLFMTEEELDSCINSQVEYTVTIPIKGKVAVTVLAHSEKEAIRLAKAKASLDNVVDWDIYDEGKNDVEVQRLNTF